MGSFTPLTVALRWLAALTGVFATYNPSGYSYWDWIAGQPSVTSAQVLAGIILLIWLLILLRATLRSLGPIGMSLGYALFGSVAWLLSEWGVVDLTEPRQRVFAGLSVTASVLGIGLSWSGIRYKISGQYDSEDVGNAPFA
jgi:hypothetical protein